MVLEEKLNNEKTNGSEYLKLDIPSEYLAAPGQSEGIGAGGGRGGRSRAGVSDWQCMALATFLLSTFESISYNFLGIKLTCSEKF